MRSRSAAIVVLLLGLAAPLSAAIRGVVMTYEGKPVAEARVVAYAPENEAMFRARFVSAEPVRAAIAETKSDAKGAFTLDAGKSGTFDVGIEARGFAPAQVRAAADFDLGAIPLTVAPLKSGRVTAGGKPLPDVRIAWMGIGGARHHTITDEEGQFLAPEPLDGSFWLAMWHPDFALHQDAPMIGRRSRKTLDIVAKPGVPLRGRVVGADRRSGVAGATVYVDGWPLAKSDEDGSFTIAHASDAWKEVSAATADRYGIRGRSAGEVLIVLGPQATVIGTVVDGRTNRPLAGAEVRAWTDDRRQNDSVSAFTDGKGGFALAPLLPGSYTVSFRMPGYEDPETTVQLRAGERAMKNLAGKPMARLEGSVLDEEKRPVAAARVAFLPPGWLMQSGFRFARIYAAPDGRFLLHGAITEREGRLYAEKSGQPRGEGDVMRLAPGESRAGIVLTIPRGIEVRGTVSDRDGRGIADARIEFTEASDQSMRMGFGMEEAPDGPRSGKDGSFAIRVKQGTYNFLARAPGYAPRRMPAVAVTPAMEPLSFVLDPGVEIAGRVVRGGAGVDGATVGAIAAGMPSSEATALPDGSFTLSDLAPGPVMILAFSDAVAQPARLNVTAPARDVVIEIPTGGTVRGRVTDKATGAPVSSFQVNISTIRPAGGGLYSGPGNTKDFHTDDGSFFMEGVTAGPVDLTVTAPGYARGRAPGLRVEEATPLVDVEVALEQGGRLTGRVTGPDGSPLEGVRVRAADDGSGPVRAQFRDNADTQTDANGEYTLTSLDAGEQRFEFWKRGFVSQQKTVNVSGREARLDARMSRGLTLNGTVTSAAGVPLPDATVSASGSAVDASYGRVTTDAQGGFRIEGVAPGRYQLRAEKSGFAGKVLRDVDAETAGHVRISLETGGVIYGTVRGLSAEELASVMVTAASPNGRSSSSADASGRYRIEGVAEGSVNLNALVRSPGGSKSSPTVNVEVTPGVEQLVDLEFAAGTTISGRVTRMGRPELNAMIIFSPASPTVQTSASTPLDLSGAYSVSGLENGEYTVRVVNLDRLTPYTTKYEVRGSGTFDVDMRGGTLRGRVTDNASGNGIVEAQITLQPVKVEGTTFLTTLNSVTDASGGFVIEMVAPGLYTARAQKASHGHHAVDLEVREGDGNFVALELRKEDGLSIRGVDARSGRALEVWATVRDATNRVVSEPTRSSAGDGLLRIPIATGAYRVTVGANGYAPQKIRAQAPSQEIRVALTPGGSIAIDSSFPQRVGVRLIDAAGTDYLEDVNYYGVARLDPGKSTMPAIAPGAYTLQAIGAGGQVEKSVPVTVQEGQVTNVSI